MARHRFEHHNHLNATAWMDHAACADENPDLFFVERGVNADEAKAICATCPVRAACLAYALATNQLHGIWGGLSEKERKRLRAARRRETAA